MKHELSVDEMLAAMDRDDARYDGKFFVCVKTTGIYCLPSCKAKSPRRENVLFLPTRADAIAAGFRGCRRCRSEFYPRVQPEWWDSALVLMNKERHKIHEKDLAERAGVDISTIRRYCKHYLRITPMAFHRRIRLNYARGLLERGADYLSAAYECGFESASG